MRSLLIDNEEINLNLNLSDLISSSSQKIGSINGIELVPQLRATAFA